MDKERLKEIGSNSIDGIDLIVPWSEVAQMANELLALYAEIEGPSEECENCEKYYLSRMMRLTEDEVRLCPTCWNHCCKDFEEFENFINPPSPKPEA